MSRGPVEQWLTERALQKRIEKLSGEIIELRRDFIEGITQHESLLNGKGGDGSDKQGENKTGGELVLYRRLGNIENRQEAVTQSHIAEVRSEMDELRSICKAPQNRQRGQGEADPPAWCLVVGRTVLTEFARTLMRCRQMREGLERT